MGGRAANAMVLRRKANARSSGTNRKPSSVRYESEVLLYSKCSINISRKADGGGRFSLTQMKR